MPHTKLPPSIKLNAPLSQLEQPQASNVNNHYGSTVLSPPIGRRLSDFDPSRKKPEPNLIDQIRQLLPLKESKTAAKDHSDDEEAKIRLIKTSREMPTIKVFRPVIQEDVTSPPVPEGNTDTIISDSALAFHSEDGYSPILHMKHLMAELGATHKEIKSLNSIGSNTAPDSKKEKRHAKRVFNHNVLGINETEFNEQKLPHHLGAYLPDDVQFPESKPVKHPTKSYKCRFAWANCGTCYCLKAFIVATLIVAIIMYLPDPCYPVKAFFAGEGHRRHSTPSHHKQESLESEAKFIHGAKSNQTASSSRTMVTYTVSPTAPSNRATLIGARATRPKAVSPQMARNRSRNQRNVKARGNYSRMAQPRHFQRQARLGSKSIHEKEHCGYKTFYIVWMAVGVALYMAIFLVYTCRLVVKFHNFPWFLLETALLTVYSLVLFSSSIAGFIFKGETESTVLGFIDALLGICVGLWTYGNHRAGLTPLQSIIDDDPDHNLVARIMASKQMSKLFSFGKKKATVPQPHEPLERL